MSEWTIDIEKYRAELGLPPVAWRVPEPLKLLVGSMLVVLLATGAGRGSRLLYDGYRLDKLQHAIVAARAETDPDRFRAEVERIRAGELVWPDPRVHLMLGSLYRIAAERLPQRRAYLEEGLAQVRLALAEDALAEPLARELRLMRCDFLVELGRPGEARRDLPVFDDLIEDVRTHERFVEPYQEIRLTELENNLAYMLASLADATAAEKARALRLAKRMIMRRPENSRTPHLLDTLAHCYHVNGRYEQALRVQREALARADGAGLDVYLEHYRAYARAANAEESP